MHAITCFKAQLYGDTVIQAFEEVTARIDPRPLRTYLSSSFPTYEVYPNHTFPK